MLRDDQDVLLRVVLALLDGSLDERAAAAAAELATFDRARFAAAGLATGLTAALGALAASPAGGGPRVELADAWRDHVDDQMGEVAARQARFATVIPRVLGLLDEAGVAAVPVKGAVLAPELWPVEAARPMSDVDLLVAPGERDRAGQALRDGGLRLIETAPWEDTFLAWGDGGVGRTDGESAEHNGKVELHPGWVERFHGYLVGDDGLMVELAAPGELRGARCRRLPRPAL
ncbi:MAG: nucleotidyltransferase family protein, partial [Acidimicrobiia bacterium]|nr:nucleotidyltransferase family protein [Acidimicrobiia bacterium]